MTSNFHAFQNLRKDCEELGGHSVLLDEKDIFLVGAIIGETPQGLFDILNEEFHFELDVCATSENAKCKKYYSPAEDCLKQEWKGICWMNPPYGREIGKWMKKAYESALAGATVVCLVPARTDTAWWLFVEISSTLRKNNKSSCG